MAGFGEGHATTWVSNASACSCWASSPMCSVPSIW
jgi:hypothetical protein